MFISQTLSGFIWILGKVNMFEQFNDIPYWLIKERLGDLSREGQASHNPFHVSAHRLISLYSLSDHLGDLLTRLGSNLKHQEPSIVGVLRENRNLNRHRFIYHYWYLHHQRRHVH